METPLPIYIGTILHTKTRRKQFVNRYHPLDLSISYERVLQISTDLGNSLCAQYETNGVVCPPCLTHGTFTTAAMDIDHNPSPATASDSFHGTVISVAQHLLESTTLRASAALINEIIEEGSNFVLISRFQSDPIELHCSIYASLRGVINSENIISLTSLTRENIDFWEEDLQSDDQIDLASKEIEEKPLNSTTGILESELSDDSKKVAVILVDSLHTNVLNV